MGVNKIILLGRLGRDPEYKILPGGDSVATLSLATNAKRRDGDDYVEVTDWHRIVVYGSAVDVIMETPTFMKGAEVWVEGSIRTWSWEDDKGVRQWTTEIKVVKHPIVVRPPRTPRAPSQDTNNGSDDDDGYWAALLEETR